MCQMIQKCGLSLENTANPAFNRTRRSELFFLGGWLWRRAG